MYEQLKKKIEEEKLHLERGLQQISSLKKTPKVFKVFQKTEQPKTTSLQSSAPPLNQPQLRTTLQQFPTYKNTPQKNRELLKFRQKEEQSQLEDHLCQLKVENDNLLRENKSLKQQLQCHQNKIESLELQQKLMISHEQEKASKIQVDYESLKGLFKETAVKNQEQQQKIITMETEHYEWQLKLENSKTASILIQQQNDQLKTQIDSILIYIKQLNHTISTELQHHQQLFQSLITDHSHLQLSIPQDISQSDSLRHPEVRENVEKLHSYFNQIFSHNRLQQKQIMALNHLISETLSTSMKYQRQLEVKEIECEKRKGKISFLENNLKSTSEEKQELEKLLSEQKEQISSTLKNQAQNTNQYKTKQNQLRIKLNQCQYQVQTLQKQQIENQQIISNLNTMMNQNQLEFDSKISLAQTREHQLISQINELKDEIQNLLEEQSSYQEIIKQHQNTEETLRKEIACFKQNLNSIAGERENSSNSSRQEKKISQEEGTEKLNQQYQELLTSQQILKQYIKDLENKLERMTKEVKEAQRQTNELSHKIKIKDAQIEELQQREKELLKQNLNFQQQKEDFIIKLRQNEAIIQSLKQQTMKMYVLQKNYQQLREKYDVTIIELEEYKERQKKQDSSVNEQQQQKETQKLELEDIKLKQQILTLSEELKNYRSTSIAEKVIYQQKVQELQQIILREENLKQEIGILRDELNNKNAWFEKIEEKYETTEEQLINSQKQLEVEKEYKTKIEMENEYLRDEVKNLHSIVASLSDQLNKMEKQPQTPEKKCHVEDNIEFPLTLAKINSNCLKNNCDSVGMIKVELSKLGRQVNYHLISSPTDYLPFNTKLQEIDQFKLDLEPKERKEPTKECDQRNDSNAEIKERSFSEEDLNESNEKQFRKKQEQRSSCDVLKVPESKKTLRSSQIIDSKKNIYQIEERPKSSKIQSHLSLEVNPDLECGTLPYSQLFKHYNILKAELQKMQDYIGQINRTNLKIKKSIQNVDNYAHFKTIDKILQKFGSILRNKDFSLQLQSREFINQIQALLTEIQNYIHFIDKLSKIEPFSEYHRLNKIQRMGTMLTNQEKEKTSKKTFSQGESPNDNLFEPLDGNICEYEEFNSPPDCHLNKQEVKDIQKYFDDNKELYSEISSVKNKSLKSNNSFINSRSQIWQFGFHPHKSQKKIQLPKVEAEEEDKLTNLTFDDLKLRYDQIKEKNKLLILAQANREKEFAKKIEDLENTYKKKLNKMTKEFNDSFKVLCKASDQQLKAKKEPSPNQRKKEVCQFSVQEKKVQNYKIESCESITISQEIKTEKNIQDLEEKLKQQQEKLKEKETQNGELTKKMKMEKMQKQMIATQIKEEKIQPLTETLKKYNKDFSIFMKTLASKIPEKIFKDPSYTSTAKEIKFRKSSSSLKLIPIEQASSPKDENFCKIIEVLRKSLKLRQDQLNEEMQLKSMKLVIEHAIISLQKNAELGIVETVTEYIKKFLALENEEERYANLQEIRLSLSDYFGSSESVSELIKNTNMLIRKLTSESVASVDHLSINSYCQQFRIGSDKEKQEDEEQDLDNFVVRSSKLKEDKEKLFEKMNDLTNELRALRQSNASRDVVIHWQEEEIKELKQQREQFLKQKEELLIFQKEKNSLNQQLSKLKQKSQKKSKVIYLGH